MFAKYFLFKFALIIKYFEVALVSLGRFVMNLSQPFSYFPFLYYHILVKTILEKSRVLFKAHSQYKTIFGN